MTSMSRSKSKREQERISPALVIVWLLPIHTPTFGVLELLRCKTYCRPFLQMIRRQRGLNTKMTLTYASSRSAYDGVVCISAPVGFDEGGVNLIGIRNPPLVYSKQRLRVSVRRIPSPLALNK